MGIDTQTAVPMADKFQAPYWRAKTVARYFGVHINTVYNWVKSGILPAPIQIGAHYTAWDKEATIKQFNEHSSQKVEG